MTNNQHGQVPEALRLANLCSNLTRYSMDAHLIAAELRRQHARIAEIEAVGAGGVQALSAAPAEQEEAAQRLRKTLDIDPGDVNDPLHPRYIAGFKSGHAAGRRRAAPAASPTPPAEQQAQPGAVYAELGCDEVSRVVDVVVERCISLTQDATGIKVVYDPIILGDALLTELRDFADRTHALRMQAAPKAAPGDPYQDSTPHLSVGDSSFESWFGSYCPANKGDKQRARDAYAAGMGDPLVRAAPQQEAQEPCPTCVALARTVMLDQVSFDRKPDCYGIRQITDDEGVEEWEDIRTSPDVAREEANDMMATGRGEIYEVVPLYTAPLPAPAPLSEMPYEKRKAIQEGEQIGASDAWFHARHNMLDTLDRRNVFRAGFDRGWNAALAAQGGE